MSSRLRLNLWLVAVIVTSWANTARAATPTAEDVKKSADCFGFYLVSKEADPSASGKEDSAQGMKFTGLMLNTQAADMKLDDAGKKDIVHKAVTDAQEFVKTAIDKHDTAALEQRDNACRKLVADYAKQTRATK